MNETFDKVKQLISALFNVDESTITRESSPATIPEWDSMGQLMLIIEIEQQFDRQISPEVGEKLLDVGAIVDVLSENE